MANATRHGIRSMDLKLFSEHSGNILTAVKIPPGIDGIKFVEIMHEKYGVYIAGAQAPYKGTFFRIAHLGYMGGFDIITALAAIEMSLADLGYHFNKGKSIQAAENILKENWE